MAHYGDAEQILKFTHRKKAVTVFRATRGGRCETCARDQEPTALECAACARPVRPRETYRVTISGHVAALDCDSEEEARECAKALIDADQDDESAEPADEPLDASPSDGISAQIKKLGWGNKLRAIVERD